ncbi:MAG: CRISPR system precrRNA processing endoribonuclease RAMP protein Cas6 [bacterium]
MIFEGIPDTERFARYKTPPKPYTIYFHSTPLKTGITLTLWGKAAQFRDLAVLAVSAIGTRGVGVKRKAGYGRFSIKNIEEKSLDFSGFNKNYPIPYTPEFTLNLKTPLRIKRQGKVLTSFDIKEFMKTLLERQSLLSYYYDENPEILDYRNLLKELESVSIISAATEFKYIERYSRRQKRFVNMAGIIGSVRIRDFPISLWDHICFGIYTGCGEHTTAGLGKYEILAEK